MRKILAVDDEQGISVILEKFLTKSGFDVIIANSGQQAIDIMRSDKGIELIVLDIKMPGVSGVDVLKEMARMNNNTPVIILSGSIGVQENVDELNKLGYDEKTVLYKPVDLTELLERIKQMLPNN
ncbi:MAG: response regulator [Candidatus Omnitrophota bacterium]